MNTKRCPKCKRDLPATTEIFYQDDSKKSSLSSWCIKCSREGSRKWYKEHHKPKQKPPKIYEHGEPKTCTKCGQTYPATAEYFPRDRQQYCGWSPWCKKCKYAVRNRWQQEHKEQERKRLREYKRKHRKRFSDQKREWRQRTKSAAVHQNNRKASLYHAGKFTADEWNAILNFYAPNGHCLCCGNKRKLTVDHVKPLSIGGSNTVDNLQVLCVSCNSVKHDSHIDYRPDKGTYAKALAEKTPFQLSLPMFKKKPYQLPLPLFAKKS